MANTGHFNVSCSGNLEVEIHRPGLLGMFRRPIVASCLQFSLTGIQIESDYAVREGAPAQNIIDYVNEHSISLVVMSTHGHGGIRRLLVGSVTDRVIRSCEVPVLVVPCS